MRKLFIKNKKDFGFTLVETLFGVSIFIIITLALTMLGRNIWIYNSFISSGLSTIDGGRKALKNMIAEIRTASSADTGAYAINQADASTLIFYSDVDDNGIKERIRYFLNGTQLQRGVVVPTGSPLVYDLATEKISTILYNLTSNSIFSYYDTHYDGTTPALAFPVDIGSIRLIKITLTVDKDPTRTHTPMIFTSQVTLRNLKDNL